MKNTQSTEINLATIETDGAGTMTISLEYADGKRVLMARPDDGTGELLADQPANGYPDGNPGIVAAMNDIYAWYCGAAWELKTLVDWRDYAA